jgi:hypothetical protein
MGRPIRRPKRSAAAIEGIRGAIRETLAADKPMTVRQLFYRLVSQGVIDKTEGEYKMTVGRLTVEMRRAGEIPYGWIADNTRRMRKPYTHSSPEGALELTAETYRRAVWDDQDASVEVWLEKDALSGVLYPVTAIWDVPLMVTRGFASLSFLYEAAAAIQAQDKPTYIYYLGDHDPSGVDIPRDVEKKIREHAPDSDITFTRVAVNPEQIDELNLPTRPTKKTDSRSKNFQGESVEVDAIPPAVLRNLVESCITQHINYAVLKRLKQTEAAERKTLLKMAQEWEWR